MIKTGAYFIHLTGMLMPSFLSERNGDHLNLIVNIESYIQQ